MLNKKLQCGRSMIENFSTKFVNFATVLVVKCKNLRKVCRVRLLVANQNSLHRGNVLAFETKKQSYFNSIRRTKQTQGGRSMIEMLGVLAIMAVITVLSIMAYTMAMKNLKINKTKSDVAAIAQQVREMIADNDYSILGHSDDFNNRFIKTGLIKNNLNGFGYGEGNRAPQGYSLISNGGIGGVGQSSSNYFRVVIWGLKKSDALLLDSQDWDGSEQNGCYNLNSYINCNSFVDGNVYAITFK